MLFRQTFGPFVINLIKNSDAFLFQVKLVNLNSMLIILFQRSGRKNILDEKINQLKCYCKKSNIFNGWDIVYLRHLRSLKARWKEYLVIQAREQYASVRNFKFLFDFLSIFNIFIKTNSTENEKF